MNKQSKQIVWLACGENCMPINVLRRHKKNAPSTPFSAGRSDIEHLKYFEATNYNNLLQQDYIIKVRGFSDDCFCNMRKKSSGLCRPGRHLYLEFTHHNPHKQVDRNSIERKIKRMLDSRDSKEQIILFYHHRSREGFRKSKTLIKKNFVEILKMHKLSTKVLCYSQQLVKNKENKGIDIVSSHGGRITFCTMRTIDAWGGSNLDEFFGRRDDKLFEKMLTTYEHQIIKI